MILHHRILGEGEPLIILHGLFGSSDNWQTLGKQFAKNYKVYFVDQRNHGKSFHSDEFSYDLMVDDLYQLITETGERNIRLIGHSMGGKTAIAFAAKYPELLKKLVVVDIGFKQYANHHDDIIAGMESLDLKVIKSRGQADKKLADTIDEWGIRQFLLKNLYWVEKGQLDWQINLPVLKDKMPNIIAAIEFDKIEIDTLFINGGKSNYIRTSDFPSIKDKFPSSDIITIEEVGHWVHAEAPQKFYDLVSEFLRQ
jgi:esterase